jgi:hypothetical protein
MVETYEENIEDWYKNERDSVSLTEFLCERVILKDGDKCTLYDFNLVIYRLIFVNFLVFKRV